MATPTLGAILNNPSISDFVREALHSGDDEADWKRFMLKLGTLHQFRWAQALTQDRVDARASSGGSIYDKIRYLLQDFVQLGVGVREFAWGLRACGLGEAADKIDGGAGRPIIKDHPELAQLYGKVIPSALDIHQQMIRGLKLSHRFKQFLSQLRPVVKTLQSKDDFDLALQDGVTEFATFLLSSDVSVGAISNALLYVGQFEVVNRLRKLVGASEVVLTC